MIKIAVEDGTPLLGICRGMQQTNTYFGGKISGADNFNVSWFEDQRM